MEKIAALIDKLQELKAKDATLSDLAYYTQLLYAELMCAKGHVERENSAVRKKVAVIMPGYQAASSPAPVAVEQQEVESFFSDNQSKPDVEMPQSIPTPRPEPVLKAEPEQLTPSKVQHPKQEPVFAPNTLFNQPDIYTQPYHSEALLSASSNGKELNEVIAEREYKPSLNDKLKTEKVELAARLNGAAPVNDLSKAIGINDKFLFINELFRGDRDMYDRSIKTINGCSSLESAEYWIERELKIKLGWQEKDNAVQQFYHLIRKRFAAA